MAESTTGELYKSKAILEEDLVSAVEASMTDPSTTAFLMGEGYTLDLAVAVAASKFAIDMLADPKIREASKRSAVRTAILLAWPVKA